MVINLYTESFFDAAHKLNDYDGICSMLHGHTWKICVWIRGDESLISKTGILWDFNNLHEIISKLDHSYLNEKLNLNPTAENLSLLIYRELKEKSKNLDFKVRLYESVVDKKSYCELGDF